MSAFHRVDDIESLTAERFFKLATRLYAYEGALRFRARNETEEAQGQTRQAPSTQPSASPPARPAQDGKKHFRDITHNPELLPYFD